MLVSSSWFQSNWPDVIGAVGIIGSLLMAVDAARRDANARETENLLMLAQHHRELWGMISQKTELTRLLRTDIDTASHPPTTSEEEFVNLVIVLFRTSWSIALSGGLVTREELAADVAGFLSLPIPQAVWKKTRQFRHSRFVRFVNRALHRVTSTRISPRD